MTTKTKTIETIVSQTDEVALLQGLKERIEKLSDGRLAWSRGALTPRHTQHTAFINGAVAVEGVAPAEDDVPLRELVEAQYTAIKAHRQAVPGPVDLVWRVEPQIEATEGRQHIYCRLCFEPSLVCVAQGVWVEAALAEGRRAWA